MGDMHVYFRPPEPAELMEWLVESCCALAAPQIARILLHGGQSAILNANANSPAKDALIQEEVKVLHAFLKKNPLVTFGYIRVTLTSRGNLEITCTYEGVHLNCHIVHQQLNNVEFFEHMHPFLDALGKRSRLLRQDQLAIDKLPDAAHINVAAYDRVVSEMTASVARLTSEVERQIAQVSADHVKRTLELEAEDKRRKDALKDQEKAMRDEIARAHEELSKQRQEVLDKQALLDRRKSLEQTLKILDSPQAFSLSETAVRKRHWVNGFMVLALGVAGTGMFFTGRPVVEGKALEWYQVSAFGLSAGAVFGLVIFYLRFVVTWAADHARREVETYKMRLDFRRAHWFTEFMLEHGAQKTPEGKPAPDLPDQVVERLTAGLFEPLDSTAGAKHPVEDVMDHIRQLTAKGGPVEIRFEGKGKPKN